MRDGVLLVRRQFREGLLVSVRDEERIVAEALRAARLLGDPSEALPDDCVLDALRIDERDRAGEVGAAVRDAREVLEKKRVVVRRVAGFARVARAADARSAAAMNI